MSGKHLRLIPGVVAGAMMAGHAGPASTEPQPTNPWPPIVFYVAKGDPNACGPGCREWIVAEGTIDRDAPARLRGLLNRLGQRKPPIYFHSPGGSVDAGLAIGRLMRERRMTAGVGRTIPLGCDPTKEQEAACNSLKRSGRELQAELRTARTLCNSSCVYALIGAAVREVAPGARIGVHEIALGRYDERGIAAPLDRKNLSPEQLKQLRAEEARLARYIGEMGIDKALFEAAAQIGHERVRFLSLDEIARFGIDRREFQESRWMVDEGPPGPLAVIKFVVEAKGSDKGSEPKQFRTTLMRLTCGRPGEIRMQYSRELASSAKPASIAVTTHNDAFVLAPPRAKPMLGYNDVVIEDRLARVPVAFFEEAAAGDAIELNQAGAGYRDAGPGAAADPALDPRPIGRDRRACAAVPPAVRLARTNCATGDVQSDRYSSPFAPSLPPNCRSVMAPSNRVSIAGTVAFWECGKEMSRPGRYAFSTQHRAIEIATFRAMVIASDPVRNSTHCLLIRIQQLK